MTFWSPPLNFMVIASASLMKRSCNLWSLSLYLKAKLAQTFRRQEMGGGQYFIKSLADDNFAFILTSLSTKNIKALGFIFRALECDMGAYC